MLLVSNIIDDDGFLILDEAIINKKCFLFPSDFIFKVLFHFVENYVKSVIITFNMLWLDSGS